MPVVYQRTAEAASVACPQSLHRLCGRAKPLQGRKIKGAARRTVRPKSREETPKEGNEVSEELANLVGKI